MSDVEPPEGWMAELSAKGREATDAALARQGFRLDLDGIVSSWVAIVKGTVNDQSEDYYDDYAGYLGRRESIDELIAALPDRDASVVLKAIAAADDLFRGNTFDDGGEAMSRMSFRIREQWYWRRVPIRGPITRSLGIAEG